MRTKVTRAALPRVAACSLTAAACRAASAARARAPRHRAWIAVAAASAAARARRAAAPRACRWMVRAAAITCPAGTRPGLRPEGATAHAMRQT